MLALSAFFAIKDAVSAAGNHQVAVELDAPATPERILLACEHVKRLLRSF
jgi:xanthine dehydrogenase large subunit